MRVLSKVEVILPVVCSVFCGRAVITPGKLMHFHLIAISNFPCPPHLHSVPVHYSCRAVRHFGTHLVIRKFSVIRRSRDRAPLMYSFKYNQLDATFYNILYHCLCCTCSGRFLRPSSGAQELYTQHLVCARLACCYR